MRRRFGLCVLLVSLYGCIHPHTLHAQYTKLQGWCEDGNTAVTIPGTQGSGTQRFQRSYPSCTVTVYDVGTLNLSTIYADSTGTAKANPFTAASSGQWFFYAAPAARFDIKLSGGGIGTPFTLGDAVTPLTTATTPITGTGVTNYLPKFTSATNLSTSAAYDYGNNQLLIGSITTDAVLAGPTVMTVGGSSGFVAASASFNANTLAMNIGIGGEARISSSKTEVGGTYLPLVFYTDDTKRMAIKTGATQVVVGNASGTDYASSPVVVTVGNPSGFVAANATADSSIALLQIATLTANLRSDRTGAGSYLPLAFYTNGAEKMRLTTGNQLLFGNTATDVGGTNIVTVGDTSGFVAAGAVTNASVLSMSVVNGTYTSLASNRTGSGTYLPMAFFTNGGEQMRLLTAGPQLLVGNTSTDLTLGTNPYVVTLGNTGGFVAAGSTVNASVLSLTVVNGSYTSIASNRSGAGTYLPMAFFANGAEKWRIDTSGNWVSAGVAQASLGTPANGSIIYCTDCTIANPCAGGGTGAIAKRLNSVWVCN